MKFHDIFSTKFKRKKWQGTINRQNFKHILCVTSIARRTLTIVTPSLYLSRRAKLLIPKLIFLCNKIRKLFKRCAEHRAVDKFSLIKVLSFNVILSCVAIGTIILFGICNRGDQNLKKTSQRRIPKGLYMKSWG